MRLFGALQLALAQMLICATAGGVARADDSRFAPRMQRYSTQDGLPSNRVIAIAQDQQRYIWVATERGAVRFDGETFVPINPAAGVPELSTETLYVDQRNRLWLGVTNHGMCALQADRQHSICFSAQAKTPHKLPGNDIFAVTEFAGRIWLAVFGIGLVEVDAATLAVIQTHTLNNPDIVAATSTANSAYFASFSGFVSEISVLNSKPTLSQNVYKSSARIVSLTADNEALWLGLREGAGALKIALNEPAKALSLAKHTAIASLGGQTVFAIAHGQNQTFFGSERGLAVVQSDQIRTIRATPGGQNGLPEGPLNALLVDHERGLWIASSSTGLAHWDAQTLGPSWLERGEGRLPGSRVAGASGAQSGVIWVAMHDSGVVGVFPDATFERLPVDEKGSSAGLPSRSSRAVRAQGQGAEEVVWIGHQQGLSQYSPQRKQFRHWQSNGAGRVVDLLEPNGSGGMWLVSHRAELFELDANFGVLSQADKAITGGDVEQIARHRDGILLAGIGGLRELKKDAASQLQVVRRPITEPVHAFAECGDALWVALDKRLIALDKITLTEHRDVPRPLGLASDIGGMACSKGTLWFAGPGGLWRLAQGALQAERIVDGISQVELSDYPFQSLDHAFLIGSVDGLLRFEPNFTKPAAAPFPLWLIEQSTGKGLGKQLQLPWRTPKLAVEAHALTYSAPGRTQYQFQLRPGPNSGFASNRTLDLTGIAPGTYTLSARARNAQGVLASAPAIEIVLPAPPWQRWYARLSFALVLLAIAAIFGAWLSKRRLQRRSRLENAHHTEQLALARTETLGYISHEMRNLLNGVTGNAELLTHSADRAQQLKLTGRIVHAGNALAQLLDDALDHTKLVVHRLDLHLAPFDLAELLYDAFESQRPGALAKGLRCEYEFVDVERSCESDAGRIRQILVNLLSNAVKFTGSGWLHLHASYRSGALHVYVSDSGQGVPAPARRDVFKPYVRLNRGARGSGLGLAISAELARALGGELKLMGGELSLSASPDENVAVPSDAPIGSQFALILPLPTVPSAPETAPHAMPSLNILVIEDEEANQVLIGELLCGAGHTVALAADSFAALGAVTLQPFDVVLMDLDLDGSSGLDLALILAAQENMVRVPIIALSGRAELGDRNACIQAGMLEHVAKPYRLELIHAAIRRALKIEP